MGIIIIKKYNDDNKKLKIFKLFENIYYLDNIT